MLIIIKHQSRNSGSFSFFTSGRERNLYTAKSSGYRQSYKIIIYLPYIVQIFNNLSKVCSYLARSMAAASLDLSVTWRYIFATSTILSMVLWCPPLPSTPPPAPPTAAMPSIRVRSKGIMEIMESQRRRI